MRSLRGCLQRRQHVDELVHEGRIEPLAGLLPEQPNGRFRAHGAVIRPVGREGLEIVDESDNPRARRDLLTREAIGVPHAVPPFMMAPDQRRDGVRERHLADNLRSDLRMTVNLEELLRRQGSGLGEDLRWHGHLADVVQQRGDPQPLNVVLRHAHGAAQTDGIRLHACEVLG